MDIETPGKPDDNQAEFNNALAFLERLNRTEYMIEFHLISWSLKDAYSFLESYENELNFCFKEDEKEEIKKIKIEILNWFNKYPRMGGIVDGDNGKYIINPEITPIVRNKLIELNKYLRLIKYKRGMGMPKKGESKLF
jgi:hypothetical protein